MSACVCEPVHDAGFDGGPTDAGVLDAGDLSDAGTNDSGLPNPPDAGCRLASVTLFSTGDPDLHSVAVGISPSGQAIAVNLATLAGWRTAVWLLDGGVTTENRFADITASSITESSVCGSVLDSPAINPRQAFRSRFGAPLEVLSDAGASSNAQAINSRRTTVGAEGFTAAEWADDGGPGKRVPPISLGAASSEFSAIDENGLVAGNATTITNASFPFTVDAVSWSALSCPRVNCRALALAGDHLVGYAGSPVVPARWTLSTGEYEELETHDQLVFGQALATRGDGLTGGVLVFGNSQGPQDGVAAVWSHSQLVWLAPDAGPASTKIVSIVGIGSDGLKLAGNCYVGDRRVACRIDLYCGP